MNWLGTIAQMLAVFFVAPILVESLGDERYGVWAFIESILAYLTLFDLGIGAAVVRYVAKFDGGQDCIEINRTFTTSLFLFLLAGLGVFAVAALILGPLWLLLPIPQAHRYDAWWLLALLSLNLAMGLPLGVYAAVLDGLQRYVPKTTVRIVTLVIRSFALVYVVSVGGGLSAIAMTVTCVAVFENAILCALAHLFLPGLRIAPSLVDWSTLRMIGAYSGNAFLAMVAGRISFQTDAIVIGLFLPLSQITYFALPSRLVEQVKSGLRSLTTVLTPHVSKLEGQNDFAAIRKIYFSGTRYVLWAILPVQIGFWWYGYEFFKLWIGETHATECYPILMTLSLPLSLILSQSIAGRILYGMGAVAIISRIAIFEAIVNLLLSLLLVSRFGIFGVALGTIIPNFVGTLIVIFSTCRHLNVSFRAYVLQSFAPPIVFNSIATFCFLTWLPAAKVETWTEFFIAISICYAALTIPGYLYERASFAGLQIATNSQKR